MRKNVAAKRIGLGTVQFGTNYGVVDPKQKLTEVEIAKTLDLAQESGVELLDTAFGYGSAETEVGRYLNGNSAFKVVTKTAIFPSSEITADVCSRLRDSFLLSLERLRVDSVYGLLVHDAKMFEKPGAERLAELLRGLVDEGLAKKVGVSVYDAGQLDKILKIYPPDLVQLPTSVVDQRLLRSGHLERLSRSGVEIHGRTIFLQGVLLASPEKLPPHFKAVRSIFENFAKLATAHGLSQLDACIKFALDYSETDVSVVGVNSANELNDILSSLDRCSSFTFDFEQYAIDDDLYLNPLHWSGS